jgi:hypothetical protein
MIQEPRHILALAVALVALPVLFAPHSASGQERTVRDRVENSAFGFAVTIPPDRTATQVQHSGGDSPTLFITVALSRPVGLDFFAAFGPNQNNDLDADVRAHIKSLRDLHVTNITYNEGQPTMLGKLPARKYRVHCLDSEGSSYSEVWIVAKRALSDSKGVVTYTVTLGGLTADVAASESDLDTMVRSFEVIDFTPTPPNKSLDRSGGCAFRIIIGPARLE